jgi:hypothetical protein
MAQDSAGSGGTLLSAGVGGLGDPDWPIACVVLLLLYVLMHSLSEG